MADAGGQKQQIKTEYLSTRRTGDTGGKQARMRDPKPTAKPRRCPTFSPERRVQRVRQFLPVALVTI